MTTFDEREQTFERKYAHDAEMQFKAQARRNKLLGLWAADRMGLVGDEAEEYARSVIMADLAEAGDDDVFRKVTADLEEKGASTEGVRVKMDELLAVAKVQVMSEAQ
jgi:hypothetical protein